MTDFLKSAFGYISGGSAVREDNDFVGQIVELGNQKLRVKRKIAEGGFAFVFVAQDIVSGKEYALKRLLANDQEKNKAVVQEIKFLKKLNGHPNIVQFEAAASIGKEESGHGQAEFLVLMELCAGQVVDMLNQVEKPLPIPIVLKIFYQTCKAVQHMHKQSPPIIHRDLKVENLLISSKGFIKLCDFGSATTETHYPDQTWSAMKRSLVEDEITKNTTPMYRTPEMLDLYQNFPINESLDIWALGCVLYMLCYGSHPYEDSAKLRIINANYSLPVNRPDFDIFHDLIMGMFKVNPVERPTINDVVERLEEIAQAKNVCMIESLPKSFLSETPIQQPAFSPTPAGNVGQQQAGYAESAGSLFSSIKLGAGNLMKGVKDASAKVVETVSAINKSELDISYITSRIAVMSFPAEGVESAIKNHIDDVRNYLEGRHKNCYAVYNLSQRQYKIAKFENRVSECGWPPRKAPTLANLFAICKNMHLWLRQNPKNICVVHCLDGKSSSAMVVGAFLVFCKLFDSPQQAISMFSNKRCTPDVTASQRRYIEYISEMVGDEPYCPHTRPIIINSITMAPVPLFNKMKNGCTPFVEVYVGEDRIFTTSQEYEKMKGFSEVEGKVTIPLNISAAGDITIMVYHARSTFGGKIQGKITSMKMFQFQIYSGFVKPDKSNLRLTLCDLDNLDTPDKYPEKFSVTLATNVSPKDRPPEQNFPWAKFDVQKLLPRLLVSNKEEMQEIMSDFGILERSRAHLTRSSSQNSNNSPQHASSDTNQQTGTADKESTRSTDATQQQENLEVNQSKPKQEVPTANFFETLDWLSSCPETATPVQEVKIPKECESSLLDNTSEDEDDFSVLTQQRLGVETKNEHKSSVTRSSENLFDMQPNEPSDSSNVFEAAFEDAKQVENADVDFFNMNSGNELSNDLDLMHMEKMPSNLDILSGATVDSSIGFDNLSSRQSDSSFDPFQMLVGNVKPKDEPDMNISAPKNELHSFDPFASLGRSDTSFEKSNSSSNFVDVKTDTAGSGGDLMGDWNSFVVNSSPNISRNSSLNNLLASDSNIPRSASSTFQNIGGVTNIPRNNSTSFLGVQSSGNIPRNSSGTVLPSRGINQSPSFGMSQNQAFGKPSNGGKIDPFASLGSFGSAPKPTLGQQAQAQASQPQQQQLGKPPMGSGYMGGKQQSWQPQPQQKEVPSPAATTKSSPRPANAGNQQPLRPNYYQGGVFSDKSDKSKKPFSTMPHKATFDDLLPNDSGFTKKDEGPKTIGEMKKKVMAEEMDPIKLKVMDWTKGKERNIRTLLCSLHTVLWEDENRWKQCGMHDLVTADQVKKMYRKAVLCVHPDKLTDSPNLPLARAVFVELNDGWAQFEEEGMKSLY